MRLIHRLQLIDDDNGNIIDQMADTRLDHIAEFAQHQGFEEPIGQYEECEEYYYDGETRRFCSKDCT